VKVVSSVRYHISQRLLLILEKMGEQSVGKSFALNHLVETPFAGSAIRPTGKICPTSTQYIGLILTLNIEGVWLSVTPTKDYLLVALDFEGLSVTSYWCLS